MILKTKDNKNIFVKVYENPEIKAKGIVQIAHGMSEHISRYEDFAQELVDANYIVYGNDHRGHGKSVNNVSELGIIADENGFDKMLEDMYFLTCKIKEEHPNLPIFLFAHSMGSFLAQRYVMIYPNSIDALILSGSNCPIPKPILYIAEKILNREIKKNGRNFKNQKISNLVFGSFNKKFKEAKTDFDWLTRDENEVNKYINDERCAFSFSTGAFKDLLDGLKSISKDSEFEKISKNLPILIVSGSSDPVGKCGKGLIKLKNIYNKHGIKNVDLKLYENARHEILNELNKKEVIQDIINFLDNNIKR